MASYFVQFTGTEDEPGSDRAEDFKRALWNKYGASSAERMGSSVYVHGLTVTQITHLLIEKKLRRHARIEQENPGPLGWLLIAGVAGGLGYAGWYYYNVSQINAKADLLQLPHVGVTGMVGSMGVKVDAMGNVTFTSGTTSVVAPIASLQLYNGQYSSNVPTVQAQLNSLPAPVGAAGLPVGAAGLPMQLNPQLT